MSMGSSRYLEFRTSHTIIFTWGSELNRTSRHGVGRNPNILRVESSGVGRVSTSVGVVPGVNPTSQMVMVIDPVVANRKDSS